MCTNYTPTSRDRLRAAKLGVDHRPEADWPPEGYPGYEAPILVRGGAPGQHDLAPRCVLARFGLVPRWCRMRPMPTNWRATPPTRAARPHRSNRAFARPGGSAGGRWAPMESFFEPCWESGRAVRWRIAVAQADLFAAGGLWERWTDPASGEITTSFTRRAPRRSPCG